HVVHCHDLDTLPTGVWLKRNLGVPLIYDAHEIWGYMVSRDLPEFLVSHYLRKEKRLVKHVDAVITVNERLKEYFEEITSVPITVVMNAKHAVTTKYVAPRNEAFMVLYVGTLNNSRFLEEIVDAVDGLDGVELAIGGIGKPAYVTELRERCRRAQNVEFLGVVPQEEVLRLTLKVNAVVSLFDPKDPLTRIGLPNKVFESMACGRPIIVSRDTYLAEFTEKHGIGLAVEHSIGGVREGIRRLRDDPRLCETLGKRGLERALGEFNWDRQKERLVGVYEKF
ncbi:MAG: glycosyltransferase, partial [Thermoplasmata archaeon]